MVDVEKIKANIAARKAREAQEAKEREENGGKTLAEIRQEQEVHQIRLLQEASRARSHAGFMAVMDRLNTFLDSLPPVTEEEKKRINEARRVAELQAKAQERYDADFGS